ncbi:MAG: hypothetical protein RQ741_09795 [Wenzhouxiangellaceae bacterium]|nr:hypothetical protein [Wenzhouxiangellaceae bacterium]
MLLIPMHRLVTPMWSEPIVERIFPDGRVELAFADHGVNDAGSVRSIPLTAARIELDRGRQLVAYVTAIRLESGRLESPPQGLIWRPPAEDCQLAISSSSGDTEWLECRSVEQVVLWNRLNLLQRARLSAAPAYRRWRKSWLAG